MSEPTLSRPALATRYLGLQLSGPVIASAGPRTGRIDELMLLEDAGAAAVVLPSLFEEEVIAEEMAFFEAQEQGAGMVAEFTSIMPEVDMPDLGPERHLRLLEEAKERLDIPVIASVNAVHTGSWSRYTSMMVEAGADAIELNLYAVAANAAETALDVETRYLDVIREVRQAVSVPLAVKLSPFYSSLSHFAFQVIDNGADGLVLFNRFYAPDLDLDTLEVTPRVALSSPVELRMPLRWLGILRNQLPNASLAATTGVHSSADVLKALLVGADVACTTSAVVRGGAGVIRQMLAGVESWMAEREYTGVDQLRGSVSAGAVEDPSAFERSQYISVITSLSPKV
jgi:dihydroorotate dehydrogenase (fumarate)